LKATVISTGEELVRGRTVDTNASFLAAELFRHGFEVRRIVVVGDEPGELQPEVERALEDSALVLVSGGLGPTADDRTRHAVAAAVGVSLLEDGESRRHVEERLRSFGHSPTERHLTQALFPEGATIFPNHRGTARGFACRAGRRWVVALPGVPGEMRPMFTDAVLSFVLEQLSPPACVRAETLHIFPASESRVDEAVRDLTTAGRNPSVGITVRDGVISLSIVARADDEARAEELLSRDVRAVEERFGQRVFGRGEATLATALAEQLERRGATIGVAESLTGGLVGHMLVDVPGISRFFLAGVVAYADEAKVSQLGVARGLIEEHGAVSREVAGAMARGICRAAGCDLGLSTTGIAGPTGGTPQKPVGLVYVAVCLGGEVRVARLNLRGDRWRVKGRSARHALNMARLALASGMDALPAEMH
jgi:nicotinamide-nucleotide amidase